MYNIEYLPIAQNDLISIARDISVKLNNPTSARKITEQIIKSVDKLSDIPYMYQLYSPIRPLKQEYRKLIVKKYIVFYWVNEKHKTVTITRIINSKRDLLKNID